MSTVKKQKSGTKRTVALTGGAIALIAALFQGIGFGFGNGTGFGDGDKNSTTVMNQDNIEIEDSETDAEKDEVQTEQNENMGEEQNQNEKEQKTILSITVVGNDYFYDNERITLEDFIAVLQGMEETVVVEIKDDTASLRAYNALLDRLNEMELNYIENIQGETE